MAWFRLLLTALTTTIVACGDNEAAEPIDIDELEALESPERLAATIGPAGGEIVGPPGSPWDGVLLVFPPGALSADTEISIESVVDPTPLVAPAERVGPQFRITPDQLALAVPATVTVPFDHALRDGFETPAADCRVWYRNGDGWMNAPQTASTSETVTVELSQLTTVAAGVSATPLKTSCSGCSPLPECLAGSGFCISELAAPTAPIFDLPSIAIDNGVLYYVTSPATNTFNIASYDTKTTPATQRTFVALAATPTATVKLGGRLTVEAPNIVWAGLGGYGNVRFRTDAPASRNDTSANVVPMGVLMDPLLDQPIRILADHVTFETIPGVPASSTTQQRIRLSRGTNAPSTILATQPNRLFQAHLRDIPHTSPVPGHNHWYRFVTSQALQGTFTPGLPAMTSGTSAITTTFEVEVGGLEGAYMGAASMELFFTGRSITDVPVRMTSLAFDDQDNIYAVNSLRPELFIIAPDGGVSSLLLTDQPEGSAEYAARTPRAIRYVKATDSLILVTGGTGASTRRIFKLTNLP